MNVDLIAGPYPRMDDEGFDSPLGFFSGWGTPPLGSGLADPAEAIGRYPGEAWIRAGYAGGRLPSFVPASRQSPARAEPPASPMPGLPSSTAPLASSDEPRVPTAKSVPVTMEDDRPPPQPRPGDAGKYIRLPGLDWVERDGMALLQFLAETLGPQADMKGMVDSASDAGQAFSDGNYVKGVADLGIAALSPLGLILPGTIRGYTKAGEAISDAVRQEKSYSLGGKSGGGGDGGGPGGGRDGGQVKPPSRTGENVPGQEPASLGQGAPSGKVADTTPEGVPLSGARTVIGQRYPGGPNQPLTAEDSERIVRTLTDYSEVPKRGLATGAIGEYVPPYYPRVEPAAPSGGGIGHNQVPFTTSEGVPVSGARTVIGQRYAGGPDESLGIEDAERIIQNLSDYSEASQKALGGITSWSSVFVE